MAIPLALVARLEEFPPPAVERVGEQEVVQYRGEILPLVRLSRNARAARRAGRDDGLGAGRRLRRRAAAASAWSSTASSTSSRPSLDVQRRPSSRRRPRLGRRPGAGHRFLDVQGIIRTADAAPREQAASAETSRCAARQQQYCTFCSTAFFGVDVLTGAGGHPLPGDDPRAARAAVVRGLINLRGQIVTAIDLRGRLGLPERPASCR